MKIQMGLFKSGKLIDPIMNAIDVNNATVVTMNAMAGLLDRQYQEIKERDGVSDDTYIAFDYIIGEKGCMRISKKEWYGRGGFANPHLFRRYKKRRWTY